MTLSPDSPEDRNSYVIDAEDVTEMARLLDQDMLATKSMGGLFPERTDHLEGIENILDVACGPGGWVLEVARVYPDKDVIGIDISERMIRYANALAQSRGLMNARFQVMNILQPLQFPDGSFDLVNARALFAVVPPNKWPQLLSELVRVCRPGGTIRLTEIEMPITSSPAYETLTSMVLQALLREGRCFVSGGRNVGITAILGTLLREAGCRDIHKKPHLFDGSAESEDREGWFQDWTIVYRLLKPFVLKDSSMSEEEFETTYQRALGEMLADDFGGVLYGLTVWGTRP